MSDETSPSTNPLDILNEFQNTDLSKVETSFPILKSGNVALTVTKAQWDTSTDKPFFLVEYALAQPWQTQPIDGIPSKEVAVGAPGSKIVQRIYVGKYTDKNTGELKPYGLQQIAQLFEAVHGKASMTPTPENAMTLLGQGVMAKLKFDPAPRNKNTGEVYGPQTTVNGYIRKKATA